MNSFNNIEDFLKTNLDLPYNASFHSMLHKLSLENKIVKYYKNELNSLRELRNFLVHGDMEEPLAVASEATVKRIKIIEAALISPKKIREVFKQGIVALDEHDSLEKALLIIKKKKYSQFPVIGKDGFVGLVTENGITRWLANNIDKDVISIKDTCICDVMIADEEVDSYSFLYAYDTLYDVVKTFEKGRSAHRRNFVVIVLNRKTDKVFEDDIYRILTPGDLNIIFKNIGLEK